MNKSFLAIAFAALMTLTIAGGVWAEEAKPADTAAEKPAGASLGDIKNLLGLSVYLQGGYSYNFKDPKSQENDLRIFDHKANSFGIDLAQIMFTKDAPSGGVGYRLKVSAGETAKWIHSRGLGDVGKDEFDITEAYMNYLAPVGKGLKLQLGKFATYFGAEVIEAKDNFNYSRSLLFNYAIPFTHTGLMAGYTFSDAVNANLYLVNGWDNTDDNNKGKSVGLNLNVTPIEQLVLAFNLMYGPEQDNSSNDRFLFDWIATIKPIKNLTLVVNTDYATEQKAAPDGADAKWYGIAGYAKYDFSDRCSASARAEYFNDKDGTRTTVDGVSGIPQKVKEITLTPEFKVAKAIIVRPEYRHDWSDKQSFDSGNRKSQDTIAVGVMYTW